MGCFEDVRYLTTLGKIFSYLVLEGWDVGRDEEERCDLVFFI